MKLKDGVSIEYQRQKYVDNIPDDVFDQVYGEFEPDGKPDSDGNQKMKLSSSGKKKVESAKKKYGFLEPSQESEKKDDSKKPNS